MSPQQMAEAREKIKAMLPDGWSCDGYARHPRDEVVIVAPEPDFSVTVLDLHLRYWVLGGDSPRLKARVRSIELQLHRARYSGARWLQRMTADVIAVMQAHTQNQKAADRGDGKP